MDKLVAFNWKENPASEKKAIKLFEGVVAAKRSKKVAVVVCPPFIYLERLAALQRREKKQRVALGAQDIFWEDKGPYTSEIGPAMLRALGVWWVIIGHSERRQWFKETDAMINKKIKLALADGLSIILCVGEPLAIRRMGIAAAKRFVQNQLKKDLAGIRVGTRNAMSSARNVVIAYEPLWAIGTGRYDDPHDAQAMALYIKQIVYNVHRIKPRVLYGGSVNGKNIGDYIQYKGIDGALVGGASLKEVEFKKIITIVDKIKLIK